jgi:hypothetical protein
VERNEVVAMVDLSLRGVEKLVRAQRDVLAQSGVDPARLMA